MGAILSKVHNQYLHSESVRYLIKRKRKINDNDDSDSDGNFDSETGHISKRRKLKKTILSTPQYIYQTLFKEGTDSDITLNALGHSWKLHKVYLCQSPYFASMFSGSWKETNENEIDIQIIDPNVTVDSLSTVLGSLYLNELTLETTKLVSVLATATLFQLDSVVERCAEAMIEAINIYTALKFQNASEEYGVLNVKESTFSWLLANLLTCLIDTPHVLAEISCELMVKLVSHPQLFVVQTESTLYYMLQIWLYCKVLPEQPLLNFVQMLQHSVKYFQNQPGSESYLETEKGKHYSEPFKVLRYQHIINQHEDVRRLRKNRIVPFSWFEPAIISSWSMFLLFDQGVDRGPKECSEEEFSRTSLRCGRELTEDGDHVWRWTGFLYGLDLVWVLKQKCIKVRRNIKNANQLLCMRCRRYFVCRISVAKLDSQRQIKYIETSGLKHIALLKHEEVSVMTLEKEPEYPIFLLAEILISKQEDK